MKNYFTKVQLILTCLGIILLVQSTLVAESIPGSFTFEGRFRYYEVYRPQNHHPNMPLVLSLHGYGQFIADYKYYTLMHEYADTSGFILVYPRGSFASNGQPGWNNGLRNHPFGRTDTTSNDVGFISALIDTMKAVYNISLDSVYCCGLSMGGEMTYRLAIEIGHRIAAIASVAGKLNDISATAGIPSRSIPVLHIHGTSDAVESYGPGPGNLWSVNRTLNFWRQNNNCLLPPDTVLLPDLDPNDGCTVQKISYTNCSDDSKIIFYKVIPGGHSWPGALTDPFSSSYPTNRDINASVEIWNFFKNYELISSVESQTTPIPKKIKLSQNYPNPFNPSTTIEFSIPRAEFVTLKIYNLLGQEISSLVSGNLSSGNHQYTWDASSLASGVYLYQVQAGKYGEANKMILLR